MLKVKKTFCNAKLFSENSLRLNWENFYATPSKKDQDIKISTMLDIERVKRTRISVGERQRSRELSVRFFLKNYDDYGAPLLQVCKAGFLSALGVKKDRVTAIAQSVFDQGKPKEEMRGGARDTQEMKERKESIRQHIETFNCRASHYSVKDNENRKYLRSELSVASMHRLFEEQSHVQVTYSLYYSVFREDFNLAFGTPRTDICATCDRYKETIRNASLTQHQKLELTTDFVLHRRRARKFYSELNSSTDNSITFVFDMMENQVLPKTAIGAAYYSRQLYLYVFGVICHRGRDCAHRKEDVFFYTWLECQNRKDSNLIASALHHCLLYRKAEINEHSHVRLFSDSCYGQNKNINVLSMFCSDRKRYFSQCDFTYWFPVRGHSYLPADRAFGRVSKDVKKMEKIVLPDQYIDILKKHGVVFQYGVDWNPHDYKSEVSKFVKQKKDFQISNVKRIYINSEKVQVSNLFHGGFNEHALLKKGKSWATFNPPILPNISTVKVAKKEDVNKLLNEMGVDAGVKERYEDMLSGEVDENGSDSE